MQVKLRNILLVGAVIFSPTLLAKSPAINLKINVSEPGSELNKDIYGQFMEHLGRGIYEGIWVGEDSSIPNKEGYRLDVLNALKELHVPLLRWPGGCFADEYHWRDGIGPRESRPKTVNSNWGVVIEDNAFGTHEFFALAELLGADTYVNGNLGTGTPQEMADWLQYITSDAPTSVVEQRKANGRNKPWKLNYFAIGNEAWGCGGNMNPEFYTNLYNQWASFAKTPQDNRPIMIASGGTDDSTIWAKTLLEGVKSSWNIKMDGISHHYYTLPTGKWDVKGSSTGFSEDQWFSTLEQTLRIEDFIKANVAVMDELDPEKKVGFYVDEWGTWYDVDKGTNPGFLYQQNSLRDAIVAGLNIHIFNRYADRVTMTNIAQMINVLQAMILTDKEKMVLTPTYHAFKMHVPFQDATYLPLSLSSVPSYQLDGKTIPALSVSAARAKDGNVYLSLVNTQANGAVELSLTDIKQATGWLLSSDKMDAHNTFEQPHNIEPEAFNVTVKKGESEISIPAKSLLVLNLGKI